MGGMISFLMPWTTAVSDEPDPATGLTAKDRQNITETWGIISDKKNIKANGVELFVQLFRNYPYMQDYFKMFQGMNEEELRKTPKLRAHALGAMNLLTSYVNNLEDVETLVALINKMTVSHASRNIKMPEFEKLKKMLPSYLETVLGNRYTEEVGESYMKLMTTHNAVVGQALEEIENPK